MRKKKLIIFLASLSILMCGSGATILARTETSVMNHLATGIVDIQLKEYRIQDGEEQIYEDVKDVLPGQTISKIPRIHNQGNDCYVRVKLALEGTEEKIEIQEMGKNWIEGKDGYLYDTEILKTGQDTELFRSIHIPEDFSLAEGASFRLIIHAEAIQSKNFTPDFQADSPWGAVEIQQCEKEGQYDITSFKQAANQSLEVVYQGDSKKLFSNPDDFFSNFPVMMPGDRYQESVELKNTNDKSLKLYFQTSAEDIADNDLLEQLQLKITTDIAGKQDTIYEGALKAEALAQDKLLGEIPAGKSGNFLFELSVPAELDNPYTVLTNQVKWIFSTGPIQPLTPVQTGDMRKTGIYLLIAGVATGAGTYALWKGRKKDEKSTESYL